MVDVTCYDDKELETVNINKKAAEILVECGYAVSINRPIVETIWITEELSGSDECVNPFFDCIYGRRQADAIENWLYDFKYELWADKACEAVTLVNVKCLHKWRLDRIKWCLKELIKND